MTSSYVMHAFIKINILNYFIHSAEMHVIHQPCHKQSKHTCTCNNFWALDLWTLTYPKGIQVNSYNHRNNHHTFGKRIWICICFKHLNLQQQKSLPPETSYIQSHCTYTYVTCMHVCTCAFDCSDSLIMALQGPKHGRFNNINYWELCTDTVFLLVNL